MGRSGRAWMRCPSGPLRGRRFEVRDRTTIGRTATHEIVLDHRMISADHARIEFDTGAAGFVIEDLGSTNGTSVDGVAIQGRTLLGHLHVITVAETYEFVFVDSVRAALRHGIAGEVAEPEAAPDPVRSSGIGRAGDDVTHEERLPKPLPGPLAAALAKSATPPPSNVEVTSIIEMPPAVPAGLMPVEPMPVEPMPAEPVPVEPVPGPEGAPASDEVAVPGEVETRGTPESSAVDAAREPVATSADLANEIEALMRVASPDLHEMKVDAPPPPAPTMTAASPSGFALEVTTARGTRRFPLMAGKNLVGRSREAAIRLSAPDLSRRHAEIEVSGLRVELHDLGSRHRSFVEGHPIEAPIEVEPGDRLRFGTIEARLVRADSKDES